MPNHKRLVVARRRRQLTKKELASGIGVEPPSVLGIEAGAYEPSEETFARLVRALQ